MDKKIAIVTGSSRGIGAEIVKKLAENDYSVVLNYNKSYEDARKIQDLYDNVDIYKADVSLFDEVKSLVNYTLDKYGKIDLLVNNAGIDFWGTINDISVEQFDKIIKTNLYSYFILANWLLKI
jgi:3-oxoacyl-[acyl-carrier protein] reductase